MRDLLRCSLSSFSTSALENERSTARFDWFHDTRPTQTRSVRAAIGINDSKTVRMIICFMLCAGIPAASSSRGVFARGHVRMPFA
jgi:hypothetical protein